MTDVAERSLVDIAALEYGPAIPEHGRRDPPRASGLWPRRIWTAGLIGVTAWAFWDAGLGREPVVNPAGWTVARRFLGAVVRPELGADFLELAAREAVTTIEYALVATALAMLVGIGGGVLGSERFSERDPWSRSERRRDGSTRRVRRPRVGWLVARLLNVVPRGIHEAIWALLLLLVLGADPLVAVLAIAIPFGAITAKVVAEMIDDAPAEAFRSLRASGTGRLAALVYGTGPLVAADVVSYGFYRLECSIRSSVVVGMIGAGGIGFQIAVSEDGLRYGELWTLIGFLVVMSAAADWWGASLRSRPGPRRRRISAALAVAATVVSAVHLGLRPWTLVGADARGQLARVAGDAWPPMLPRGGWSELFAGAVDTVQLSIIAIALAALVAVPVALVAARPTESNPLASAAAAFTRFVMLVCRAVPPPLWALLILFVSYPGPIAGGVALGLYTLGVLGRLDAEAVENADRRPVTVLRTAGASSVGSFAYGTMPVVAPRFVALGLYRWEVAIRETVVVGLVGAGGLGRLLQQQRAGFDEARMLTTIVTLVALAFVVDLLSARLRRVFR